MSQVLELMHVAAPEDKRYHMTGWTEERSARGMRVFLAHVWRDGVFPEPETGVKAQVVVDENDLERHRDHLPELVAQKIKAAIANCEWLIQERNAHPAE